MTDYAGILDEIAADMRAQTTRGVPADYIPELAKIDPNRFAIALTLPGGSTFSSGDNAQPFSIQSISKVFTLAIALGRIGDQLWHRVGREPSGLAFNSILQLETEGGIPRNPFVNAGAIVVTDAILHGQEPRSVLADLLRFIRAATEDDDIHINKDMAASELLCAHRNRALAHFMAAHGNLKNPVEKVIGTYVHQCAIEMNVVQLAKAGRFLMAGAGTPAMISPARVRRINALMMTCGHYNGSGEFAFQVGLAGKSGVGGGILAIAPKVASIAVYAPGLNAQGNSLLGNMALHQLVQRTGWSFFG